LGPTEQKNSGKEAPGASPSRGWRKSNPTEEFKDVQETPFVTRKGKRHSP